MSHLIEEYSKNLGVKISKPIIAKHFWPILHEKYITICSDSQVPSKTYKHYETVIDIIKKSLVSRGIKIIQIGTSKSLNLQNVNQQLFDLEFKNFAYIISKSMLHIGVDNVYSHYASSINVPIVTLFGNVYESIAKGYWSKNQMNLEAPWKVKPCLNVNDPNDFINKINPEQIAEKILNQLNINDKIQMKTKLIGDYYHNQVIEIVPNFFSAAPEIQKTHVFLRPDYGIHETSFINWCNYLQTYSIFSKKELNVQFCQHFASKIKNVSFVLNKDNLVNEEHLKMLQSLNIGVTILSDNKDDLAELRERYFDFSVHLYFKSDKSILGNEVDFSNLYFNSSKIILSNGDKYPSRYHFLNEINSVDINKKLEDNEILLEDLQHFYIYEQTR